MPFTIVRNDITKMQVDAIVNTTNPSPTIGYGVDMGIHKKAGPRLLLARKRLGKLPIGGAGITKGYALPAKYVIHTVCPVWQGGDKGEQALLTKAYTAALELAVQSGCGSIAFPLMSAGNHGFPKPLALQTAVSAISSFLMEHELMVYLVVFSKEAVVLSEKLFRAVESYIDDRDISRALIDEYGSPDKCRVRGQEIRETLELQRRGRYIEEDCSMMEMPCSLAPSMAAGFSMDDLSQLLEQADAGFSQTLLQLIDRSGRKDAEVYKRANVTKQTFSKIKNNLGYKPTKPTVFAFAIALELDLTDTQMLLDRAGYSLSHASKLDIIVEYFIKTRQYDIFLLNEVLFTYDQPLLGSVG